MSKPSRDILQLPIEKRAEIAFKVAVARPSTNIPA